LCVSLKGNHPKIDSFSFGLLLAPYNNVHLIYRTWSKFKKPKKLTTPKKNRHPEKLKKKKKRFKRNFVFLKIPVFFPA
jgi:hypothetical protein